MELYLLIIFIIIYVGSLFFFRKKEIIRKLWFTSFAATFFVTSIGILSISIWSKELVVTISNIGWFYLIYIFATLMVFLGVINAWIFRKTIWQIIMGKPIPAEDCTPEEELDKEVEKVIDKYK